MESYGYRFDTPDRSIVISGDTAPAQATIDACRGCDVLIHVRFYNSYPGVLYVREICQTDLLSTPPELPLVVFLRSP